MHTSGGLFTQMPFYRALDGNLTMKNNLLRLFGAFQSPPWAIQFWNDEQVVLRMEAKKISMNNTKQYMLTMNALGNEKQLVLNRTGKTDLGTIVDMTFQFDGESWVEVGFQFR